MSATRPLFSDPGGEVRSAPIGTEAWAQRVRLEMQSIVKDLGKEPERLDRYLQLCKEHRAWTLMNKRDGSRFASLKEFCAYEQPWGLGQPWETIKPFLVVVHGRSVVATQVSPLAPVGAPKGSHNNPSGKANTDGPNVDPINISHDVKGGTGAEYLAARLKRDAPAIAEQLERGEFPSVKAAARAAGIVKPRSHLAAAESLAWSMSVADLAAAIPLLTSIHAERVRGGQKPRRRGKTS